MSNSLQPRGLYIPWNSPGQNTGVGSLSLLQIKPKSPTLQADFLPAEPRGNPKNTGVGNLSFLQGIFLAHALNQGLLNCRWTIYQLSYQGSPQWMWVLEEWVSKNWCFQIVVLAKILESPLDSKEIKPINPKGKQPWIRRTDAAAEVPVLWPLDVKIWLFGELMERTNSLEKTLILGKIEGKRKSRQQSMKWLDSITNSKDLNLSKLQETVNAE